MLNDYVVFTNKAAR